MLRETARVGRIGIVSFPNFAHWPNRLHVAAGRMPVTRALPYEWYDTPNIRVGTLRRLRGAGAQERPDDPRVVRPAGRRASCARWPNLLASVAVFKFERGWRRTARAGALDQHRVAELVRAVAARLERRVDARERRVGDERAQQLVVARARLVRAA